MKTEKRDDAVVLHPASPAKAAVVWLHGLGADGNDFAPIVPELGLPADLPVRFVFPHAPVRPVSINNGMRMRAWYDITPNMRQQDDAGIRDAERIATHFIEQEVRGGIPSHRIVLAGFSQGGAITLHTGLRYPQPLAGLLALSTYLPLPEAFAVEAKPARRDTPILMCHGTQDGMLPLQLGAWSRDVLKEAGFDVTWKEYPMQHQVCPEEIEDIGAWLGQRLDPGRS
ncbi:MAG TPA: carboxylesterase [Verrucomicrobiae bacterium]|nr:carboxylesterase [Verrucomicrobiae bacterium]